jgi:hypothetical protein
MRWSHGKEGVRMGVRRTKETGSEERGYWEGPGDFCLFGFVIRKTEVSSFMSISEVLEAFMSSWNWFRPSFSFSLSHQDEIKAKSHHI